jgi:hypothetical protein
MNELELVWWGVLAVVSAWGAGVLTTLGVARIADEKAEREQE